MQVAHLPLHRAIAVFHAHAFCFSCTCLLFFMHMLAVLRLQRHRAYIGMSLTNWAQVCKLMTLIIKLSSAAAEKSFSGSAQERSLENFI